MPVFKMLIHTFRAPIALRPILSCMIFVKLFLYTFPGHVKGDCECGYLSAINGTQYMFTDLLESDFRHIANISVDTDWRRQQYNVTAAVARGPYGESPQTSQVISNPLVNNTSNSGPSELGGDAGLQFVVPGGIPSNGLVPVGELNSVRQDMLWGSYRAAIKLTDVPGTCGAFFWYFNDSQEIDIEFLSSEFSVENQSFPVNLVLQSAQSVAQGFNAVGTGNYVIANLPFDPTTAFHEYRMDFLPGSVIFYADGQVLATMRSYAIPTQAGHLILTHWSNGNPLWSAGPPVKDAIMTVSYVKSYFNSSLTERIQAFTSRCKDPHAPGAICVIPDQTTPPGSIELNGNSNASTFFFSNFDNLTVGQIVYHQGQSRKGCFAWQAVCLVLVALLLTTSSIEIY